MLVSIPGDVLPLHGEHVEPVGVGPFRSAGVGGGQLLSVPVQAPGQDLLRRHFCFVPSSWLGGLGIVKSGVLAVQALLPGQLGGGLGTGLGIGDPPSGDHVRLVVVPAAAHRHIGSLPVLLPGEHRDRRIALQKMPISHIVSCSPCFNEYVRYRRAGVAFRGLQWAAAIVLIAVTALTSARLMHFRSSGQSPATTAEKTHSTPAEVPPSSASATRERPSQVEVNLALFSTTRGSDSGNPQEEIHLPAKAVHVNFLLPTGMEPGEYAVRLLNAAGSAKIERRVNVQLSSGVASFALDLEFKPSDVGRGWRLMIRPPGLSWRAYAAAIG